QRRSRMSLMRSSRRSRSPILGRPTYSLSSSDGSPPKTAKSSSSCFSCFARTSSAPSRLMPFMPPKIAILIANPSLMTGPGGPQTLDTPLEDPLAIGAQGRFREHPRLPSHAEPQLPFHDDAGHRRALRREEDPDGVLFVVRPEVLLNHRVRNAVQEIVQLGAVMSRRYA